MYKIVFLTIILSLSMAPNIFSFTLDTGNAGANYLNLLEQYRADARTIIASGDQTALNEHLLRCASHVLLKDTVALMLSTGADPYYVGKDPVLIGWGNPIAKACYFGETETLALLLHHAHDKKRIPPLLCQYASNISQDNFARIRPTLEEHLGASVANYEEAISAERAAQIAKMQRRRIERERRRRLKASRYTQELLPE